MLYNGTWGSVCSDGWGTEDAAVVCRQLGYQSVVSLFLASGDGLSFEGKIWISRSACLGTETSIGDCFSETVWGDNNCAHSQDIAVECSSGMNA